MAILTPLWFLVSILDGFRLHFGTLLWSIFEPFSIKNTIFENMRVLWGRLERSKVRFFWIFDILFSTSISGSIFNWFSKEKVAKIMPTSMPKSLKNRYDFGTCDFLVFAKSVTLKSFFYIIRGTKNKPKSIKNPFQNEGRRNDPKMNQKWTKREPKKLPNPSFLC